MGLMGYNGVLCALALGGKTWKSFVWTLCSVLLSVVLQFAGIKLGITTLTAPFCTICMDDNDNAESGEYKR